MPDFRELSTAKIASGFGGTLCLVLSSLFIMVVVVVAAIPTNLFLLARTLGPTVIAPDGLLAWAGGPMGMATSLATVTAAGLVATAVPLASGLKAFRRLEA
jgi:ABC-2 type transport system permease protein